MPWVETPRVIKRTLEISNEPAHLCVRLDQLVLKRGDQVAGSVPCEDLGVVVVDHPQTTYTHTALSRMAEAGAVVVLCGRDHLPSALVMPLASHTEVVWRINDQIAASRPIQKRLWQQIIRAKILAQAGNLAADSRTRRKLAHLAREVRSGDAGACEAQAARLYWSAWLTEAPEDQWPAYLRDRPESDSAAPLTDAERPERELERFRRDTDGDGLNALLNYGYAIVRAALARALVAAGLHPALGLQHANRSNAFCLADDLIEPLRPLVDRAARRLWWADQRELDPPTKAELLGVLTEEVFIDDRSGPLLVALHRYVASLVRCLRRESKRLLIPRGRPEPKV
jgi:CRISPR-associated protein Cas1